MRTDLALLNEAVRATLAEVKACLLVSFDGLPLGISPPTHEEDALMAWRRLAALNGLRRGWLQFGGEVWAFTRRGQYEAVALLNPTPRVGLILHRLDAMLEEAERTLDELTAPVEVVYPDPRSDPADQSVDPETDLGSLWREFAGLVEPFGEDSVR